LPTYRTPGAGQGCFDDEGAALVEDHHAVDLLDDVRSLSGHAVGGLEGHSQGLDASVAADLDDADLVDDAVFSRR
jgi:hypothetical protein